MKRLFFCVKTLILVLISSFLVSAPAAVARDLADDTLTIVMVGDILLHTPVEDASRDGNGSYSFDYIFNRTRGTIQSADLALVNQEVILGGQELGVSGYPAFNAPYEIGDALINAGFDVVCHATNHALDKGKKGVVNTLNYWKTAHPKMLVVGLNEDQTKRDNIDIIEKEGIRIAILNYTYGTNGISAPSSMPYAVDMLEKAKVQQDLAYAEQNADFTIVCPHWGTEYRLTPDSSQQKWTEIFRSGGADLVIGTHPHVIEPVEFLEDENPGHTNNHGGGDMLVYYSLGNYVNWTSGTGKGITNRMVGGMATISLKKGANGEVYIHDHGVKALVCHLTPGYQGVTVYPLSGYTEDLAANNAIRSQDSSFSKAECVNLCNKVWGNSWK